MTASPGRRPSPITARWIVSTGSLFFAVMVGAQTYPIWHLTPGRVDTVDLADICRPGRAKEVRDVTVSVKKQVFKRYGIPWSDHALYEVDHFIPIELGGSNHINNLWPQLYLPKPGAREKDVCESFLHREVCIGRMTLLDARTEIWRDWYKCYLRAKKK